MTRLLVWPGHRLRPALLRWAVGAFCALVGALMLTAPHQFDAPAFAPLYPGLTGWGAAFFAAGAGLLMVSAVGARGPLAAAAHVGVALALMVLAGGFLLSGGWTGVAIYTVFSLATLLSAGLDRSSGPRDGGIDLFVLAAAVGALANGLVLMVVPASSLGPIFDPIRPTVRLYALLFLVGGGGVLLTRGWPGAPLLPRIATQLILGSSYFAWFAGSAVASRLWTGIILYGGAGALLLAGPIVARYAHRLDASSLRVRLALAFASAAAIPLLLVAAVSTGWQEQAATEQQLALQQALASGLAADVDGALAQHLVGLLLVADDPGVVTRGAPDPTTALGNVGEVAPGLRALGTFDRFGRPVAMPVGSDPDAQTRLSQAAGEALRRIPNAWTPPLVFLVSGPQPAIVLAAPIRRPGGGLGGIAVGELDREWLQLRFQRGVAGARLAAAVVDDTGRLVVAAGAPVLDGADLANHPAVAAVRQGGAVRGMLRYRPAAGEYLAGYARVPEADWTVIVEQPTSQALAGVWASRELTFGVLLAAFVAASALGVAQASRLAAPLASLARAAQAVAVGAPTVVTARSRIYEVRALARAFSQMQARLAARTREQERAETRLRILADASGELTRSLDEAAIVEALGRSVVGRLADWCTVELFGAEGRAERALALHHDVSRLELTAALAALPPFLGSPLAERHLSAPVLVSIVTPRQLVEIVPLEEHRRALVWLGVRSLMVVPLRARDQTLGALICAYGRGSRRYGVEDLALAQELALRAALAIDNARLFAAERTARAEAEAAVRVREEFLAIAAHELKTPVTSLLGFAELGVRALDAHGALDPAFARRTLDAIGRQSARLTALVSNLLEMARGLADRDTIAPRTVDLAELARTVVDSIQVRADRHRITLDAPERVEVVADPLRVDQVLTNLLDNALKYSPSGTAIEVSVTAGPDIVEIAVRDHGPGIPPEYQDRVFERFVQVGGDEASGMGLGLYISREIVRRHGGAIRAELPKGGGTRMVVRLPREAGSPSAREPSSAGSPRPA